MEPTQIPSLLNHMDDLRIVSQWESYRRMSAVLSGILQKF